jgi:hypothetical protein
MADSPLVEIRPGRRREARRQQRASDGTEAVGSTHLSLFAFFRHLFSSKLFDILF